MAKLKKPHFSSNRPGNKSRKQLRKEKRLGKKERKNEHYKKKFLISNLPQKNETTDSKMQTNTKTIKKNLRKQKTQQPEKDCDERSPVKLDTQALQKLNHDNEMNLKRKLEKDMKKQRKIQLLEENKYEDKEIKKLEKQLKMNKRKSKTLPKCFIEEGLDYILNVCDSDGVKNILDNQESDSEFVDDLAMVKGEKPAKRAKTSSTTKTPSEDTDSDEEMSDDFDDDDDDGPHSDDDGGVDNSDEGDVCDDDDDVDDDDQEEEEDVDIDEPQRLKNTKSPKNVAVKSQAEDEDLSCVVDKSEMEMNEDFDVEGDLDAAEGDCDARAEQKHKSDGKGKYWQDIYGRQRDEKGNIVQSEGKYIPPHLKAKMLGESSERKERLSRLSRQLKGHINRLAENNMHRIVTEMDQLYMQNSRNDMNETLTKLIFESLIQPFLIPERLVSEHTMLIAALHANVGTEVGAFFLQDLIEKFDETLKKGLNEDKKDLDNILLVISYLYIYKVCHSVLIYDILNRIICSRNSLGEKEVELLLVVLRSAGFCLRKDDPLALKDLIMKIETQASSVANNSRVKFMLSVLRAIKNNNTTKVPQYDANRYDHLRKILKTVVQKGKYISELKISLEDLLNAESRGRWWIVGSAWARDSKDDKEDREAATSSAATAATSITFTSKLLDLAKKQRMNTDARRNIFCILMSAEDYLDAFEKLLKLGLKGHQEQEMFNVIMHCCIQEKTYNPYYAYLVARLCTCNRKFVMMFQYHLWDRFKELKDLKRFQITNMAKLLAHLLLQNLLPLSALKVIEFASLERPSVRLLRQIFLTVLLSDNEEEIATVFSRVSQPPKLHIFRESIRLFLHQFLLKHQPDSVLLKNRIQMAESLLMGVNINENLNSTMF
ncbi:nucleolar MIF4G domain-containing protein 1 [Nilaparvata lugens]|uniref:nucleolar MIF4G domain-containing protein 1 n=1 Tax=Nilaparvata lugens TaxID=108931 RepID=UPI00193C86EE|nr:nucleolar MIF4G domain-containing protein 1 [Nilaparvata lugens]XP_039299735.1 nucleolar MIF4G domain-containing protein 1 [Nilaparvata lugens]